MRIRPHLDRIAFFGFLFFCRSIGASGQSSEAAFFIRLDSANRLTVTEIVPGQLRLGEKERGLLVWSRGEDEYRQVVDSTQKPRWDPTDLDAVRRTASLDQLSGESATLNRSWSGGADGFDRFALRFAALQPFDGQGSTNAGCIVTPHADGLVLNPRITIRRRMRDRDDKLPAVDAVIFKGTEEVARLRFRSGRTIVRWSEVPGLPESGLEPGTYTVQIGPGERVSFSVEQAQRRIAVMEWPNRLARLLGGADDLLYAHLTLDYLMGQRDREGKKSFPYLTDAHDWFDRISEGTSAVRSVKISRSMLTGAPTKIPEIDDVRRWIALGQWAAAQRILETLPPGAGRDEKRRQALARLYRGVLDGEAGPTREFNALSAFRRSVSELREAPAEDRFRAHNNFANFLFGRARDRLHNQAFQTALGGERPFLNALASWSEAEIHYRAALKSANELGPNEKAIACVNLARLYVLLSEIVRTLDGTDRSARRFADGEQAAVEEARRRLADFGKLKVDGDRLTDAVADEILAQLAFREEKFATCLSRAGLARSAYLDADSLPGVESVERLIGLCHYRISRSQTGDAALRARQEALRHLLIAEEVTEILRKRFSANRTGQSRAGFFSRRAYVNEKLVELLVAEGRAAEALRAAEAAKARTLQDLLVRRGSSIESDRSAPDLDVLLRNWPKDVTAIEYVVGSERVWVFVVGPGGKVKAQVLKNRDGTPLESRTLIAGVRRFMSQVDHQAPKMAERLQNGLGFDHSWQETLHQFYDTLIPIELRRELRESSTVLVAPHHILNYFPFAALVTEPDRTKRKPTEMMQPRFLIDEPFSLCYVPSLLDWDLLRRRKNRSLDGASALAVPNLPGAESLPGVTEDVKNLKNAFGKRLGTVRFDDRATEETAWEALGKPGLVLLAMHGTNVPNRPLQSHLYLYPTNASDGLLTATKVYAQPVRADLIVMSACYSALADRDPLPGDELFGLQRAFLHAGARTVVSGLWDVYDDTGPELTRGFFASLAAGKAAPTALADTQRTFLNKLRKSNDPEPWLHPYFWAVYTAAGDDRTGNARPEK